MKGPEGGGGGGGGGALQVEPCNAKFSEVPVFAPYNKAYATLQGRRKV